METQKLKFDNTLLLTIILLSFAFLGYAYYVTTDDTMRGVILGAVISSLTTVLNWKFGSSKSSANKDETIKHLQNTANTTTVKTDNVNTENIETVNANTVNTIP